MNEEELRQAYAELQSKHNELQENYSTLQNKISNQEETITTLNSTISDLKVKNYDLFLKVSNPLPTDETLGKKQEVNTMSTSDIVNKLLGGQ